MKTLFNSLYYLLIAGMCLIGVLVLATLMPVPGNIAIKVVKSGSMEPALPVGSVVINKPAATYAVGDIITFGQDTKTQVPTTHRIVSVSDEGDSLVFTVKGDANDAPDQTIVRLSDVHGKVIFDIPYLGYILAFAKTRLGFFLLVGVPALFVCFEEILKIIAEVKRLRGGKRVESAVKSAVEMRPLGRTAAQRPHAPTARNLVDLRGKSSALDLRQASTYSPRNVYQTPARNTSRTEPRPIRYAARDSVGIAMAAVLVVGLISLSRSSGDTIAYYSSNQSTKNNVFTAADNFPTSTIPDAGPKFQFTAFTGDGSTSFDPAQDEALTTGSSSTDPGGDPGDWTEPDTPDASSTDATTTEAVIPPTGDEGVVDDSTTTDPTTFTASSSPQVDSGEASSTPPTDTNVPDHSASSTPTN